MTTLKTSSSQTRSFDFDDIPTVAVQSKSLGILYEDRTRLSDTRVVRIRVSCDGRGLGYYVTVVLRKRLVRIGRKESWVNEVRGTASFRNIPHPDLPYETRLPYVDYIANAHLSNALNTCPNELKDRLIDAIHKGLDVILADSFFRLR